MGFLNIDSPMMQALSKVADLMILNLLALLCCIPIITIGPSLTALHYVSLKMARNEDCYIVRSFFKSFRLNFVQSTILGIIMFFATMIVSLDLYILSSTSWSIQSVFQVLILCVGFLIVFTSMFLYALQARFSNSILKTLKNAFTVSILQFPKTILMILLFVIPLVIYYYVPIAILFAFFFGLSVPTFFSAKLYSKFFKKLEDQIREADKLTNRISSEETEEDVRIFKDESSET
ncbi:MAG: DUF624 domain-containing protein [Clostridium sp.]|jgi:uncharacterized membrane protein YesL|nr:DUF624 domain-containing protein [Clostridium sp.]